MKFSQKNRAGCSGITGTLLFYFSLFLFIFFPLVEHAQVTKIMGKVTDSATGEIIPFVNIIVKDSRTGTVTDFNGEYSLEFQHPADSISAFLIGYRKTTKKINLNQFQTTNFSLLPQNLDLPEVTIVYSGNPAEKLIRKVIENKEKNTFQNFRNFRYEKYSKIRFDANNISERFTRQKIFNKFSFIWNYMDTSTLTGKSYLPMMMIETLSDVFERKSPPVKKEIIKASSISGLNSPSVSHFFANMSEQVNIFHNFIPILQKNFISPVSDFAITYYKFYLIDSTFLDSHWCYHVMFKPRRHQELTFSGSLWITDTSYAVKKIQCKIAEDANINFINDLEVTQEFSWTDNRYWMLSNDRLDADFNLLGNSTRILGVYGHRTNIYRLYEFDVQEEKRFFKSPAEVNILADATEKSPEFWIKSRPEKLSQKEKGVYDMIDSVKLVPLFRTYSDILYAIFRGYFRWGKVELGPYAKFLSYNQVEGTRFRFGLRTSNKFSKKTETEIYAAYGTHDQTLKGGVFFTWMYSKNPMRDIRISFINDVEQLGASSHSAGTDNFLSSVFYRGSNNKLTIVHDFRLSYEYEWFNGLINRIHWVHRQQFPLGSTEFIIYPGQTKEPDFLNSINTSEIQFDTRLAMGEKFVATKLHRYTLSSLYPIVELDYIYGIPNVFSSDYEYHKVILKVSQWFNFATIGWSKYNIEAGKIFGTLPYPLLRIHDGNQSFFYDEYAANLMNYYEFISDEWISASYTHHFSGWLFNRIPLLRKLYWREVVHVKGIFGTLRTENKEYSRFPGQMRPFGNEPYFEAGAGIENIFKVIRVDAIWRMTHLDDAMNRNVPKFGLFASLVFSF